MTAASRSRDSCPVLRLEEGPGLARWLEDPAAGAGRALLLTLQCSIGQHVPSSHVCYARATLYLYP